MVQKHLRLDPTLPQTVGRAFGVIKGGHGDFARPASAAGVGGAAAKGHWPGVEGHDIRAGLDRSRFVVVCRANEIAPLSRQICNSLRVVHQNLRRFGTHQIIDLAIAVRLVRWLGWVVRLASVDVDNRCAGRENGSCRLRLLLGCYRHGRILAFLMPACHNRADDNRRHALTDPSDILALVRVIPGNVHFA